MNIQQCDIAILGAGPAGLAAALAAARCGRRVIVIDDNPHPGGQIWRDGPGVALPPLAQRYRHAVAADGNITLLNGAKLIARPDAKSLLLETATEGVIVRWDKLILCCGARELSLPFPGWTLPGVTGAGGLQAQIKQGLRLDGQRVVIAGSGPLLLAVAASVRKAGGEIVQIAEQTPLTALARFAAGLWRWPSKVRQLAGLIPQNYHTGTQVIAAAGEKTLTGVTLRSQGKRVSLPCDRLAIGYGLIANIEPAMLFKCDIQREAISVNAWQQTSVDDIYAAGECTGFGGSELAIVEGRIAGYAAAGDGQRARKFFPRRKRWQRFSRALNNAFTLSDKLKSAATEDALLCRCEDVRCGDIAGSDSWRQAKMHQRCGMGACQGRTCAASARWLYGWPLPQPREPLSPARAETLIALQAYRPEKTV